MNSELYTWGMLIFMGALFYFMLYRPQKKQQKKRKEMLDSLKVGSRVMTIGGIYGTIKKLTSTVVTLEIADHVEIQVTRSAINATVPETLEKKESEDADEAAED
ncbi:MAG: preprotein translocase subunit YajC [Selenomonadaceae bacterium]|nr:preprotein translocase subunit YajC [Selenomonadaceae bacterium]MDY2685395.1 preprotein translocase subunit YajC [Selenomonadaceae bacterium]